MKNPFPTKPLDLHFTRGFIPKHMLVVGKKGVAEEMIWNPGRLGLEWSELGPQSDQKSRRARTPLMV